MDADRFDTLTRSLTAAGSRRSALAAVFGGALGLLGLAHSDNATAGGKCKPRCDECEKCKKGKCKKTPNGKKCKKGKCQPLPNGTTCTTGTCQGGICIAFTCIDGIRNGSESDLDCGGACPRCANGKSCVNRDDCAGAFCANGTCQECPTENAICGSDANGVTCFCSQPATGGPKVCITGNATGGDVSSCTSCPAGTVCVAIGTRLACFQPCSAS